MNGIITSFLSSLVKSILGNEIALGIMGHFDYNIREASINSDTAMSNVK